MPGPQQHADRATTASRTTATGTSRDSSRDDSSSDDSFSDDSFSVAIIGGGSGGEALVRALADSEHRTVVFEDRLVGGECPFFACMPSKALLHDAAVGSSWPAARRRRDEIVSGLDDTEHVRDAEAAGATVVRARAQILDPHHVVTDDGRRFRVDHVVIATGAEPTTPDLPGLDPAHERIWTSDDALTADDLPDRLGILGGGVIGSELAQIYRGFGAEVMLLDQEPRPLGELHPRVGDLVNEHLAAHGVDVRPEVAVTEVRPGPDRVDVVLDQHDDDDGAGSTGDDGVVSFDRLIVATGRRPRRSGLGLERLGLDPDDIDLDPAGRVQGPGSIWPGSIWMIGDVAGQHQYTHVANHHAAVVADHLAGPGDRRFDDTVVPACVFVDPPVMMVGPSRRALDGDDDVVWAGLDLDIPRQLTDGLPSGFLAIAARRSTGRVVAAHGVGAHFDELVHALVVAIDGEVPVPVLQRSIRPFPTVGEILDVAFAQLGRALSTA